MYTLFSLQTNGTLSLRIPEQSDHDSWMIAITIPA
jgi:hypothetical protein